MPRRAPTRTPKKAARKKNLLAESDVAADIWQRTRLLVEILLKVMEQGIRHPETAHDEQWERLFGNKDSVVVTLQKLVQLLSDLQMQAGDNAVVEDGAIAPVSDEEMALLREWLAKESF